MGVGRLLVSKTKNLFFPEVISLQKLIAKAYQATDATSAACGDRPGSTTVTSDMRSDYLNQRWRNNKLKCQKRHTQSQIEASGKIGTKDLMHANKTKKRRILVFKF